MKQSFRPIFVFPSIFMEESIVFLTFERRVEITVDFQIMRTLMEICDGTHDLENILESLSDEYDIDSIKSLIETLVSEGVLLDASNMCNYVATFGDNPSPWHTELPFDELMKIVHRDRCEFSDSIESVQIEKDYSERESVRSFEPIDGLNKQDVLNILWKCYGQTNDVLVKTDSSVIYRRTVPSSGGLFTLKIFLYLKVNAGDLSKGCYQINYPGPGKVGFKKINIADYADLDLSFVQGNILKDTAGCIIIVGDVKTSAIKYGTRALRYCYLDAGHVAQQALRAIRESGLSSLEVAGFKESMISSCLNLDSGEKPLITVFFGKKSDQKIPETKFQMLKLEKVPDNHLVTPGNHTYKAVSQWPSNGEIVVSRGRDSDEDTARIKAVAEIFEWCAFDRMFAPKADIIVGRYEELREKYSIIEPDSISPYDQSEMEASGYQVLNKDAVIEWVKIRNMITGNITVIPADYIYYPYQRTVQLCDANSSGCAAHSSLESAKENAVLELIERDAFLIMWLNKLSRQRIDPTHSELGDRITRSIIKLSECGFQTHFINLTLDTVPVILCIMIDKEKSRFAIGAACHFDASVALRKSFDEAESMVISVIDQDETRLVLNPKEVRKVLDHGYYYMKQGLIDELDFIYGSTETVSISSLNLHGIHDIKALTGFIEKKLGLQLYEYVLTEAHMYNNLYIRAVRVIIPGLVPINFGYKKQVTALRRIREVVHSLGLVKNVISEKELNQLPHPFV